MNFVTKFYGPPCLWTHQCSVCSFVRPSISNCEPVDRFFKIFGKISQKLSFEIKKISNSNMSDARSYEVGRNQRCFIQD
jgi:hypothetical protein